VASRLRDVQVHGTRWRGEHHAHPGTGAICMCMPFYLASFVRQVNSEENSNKPSLKCHEESCGCAVLTQSSSRLQFISKDKSLVFLYIRLRHRHILLLNHCLPAGAKQRELAKRVVAKQQVCEADKVRAAQLVFRTAVQAEAVRSQSHVSGLPWLLGYVLGR
jgi:hypothetical protein